jgi:hypothetical protein
MQTCFRFALVVTLVVSVGAVIEARAKFTSTWKSPEAGDETFAGKKVAALAISDDLALRMSAEEALVRELAARGVQGVAAYRLIPREEIGDPARAKIWFEQAGIEGVVALRIVGTARERRYTPITWTTMPYSSLWGYYPYGWTDVYVPSGVDTILSVETLIFSVPRDMLLWAGVSETKNPKTIAAFMKDLVAEAAKEMRKQGLTAKGR